MRTGQGLRAGLSLLAMLASLAQAIAQDPPSATSAPTDPARPGAEETVKPPEATPPEATPAEKPKETARESDTREALCLMVESAARAANLPLEFFARVIWQESRFQSDAVGPVTRSGQRAQGIAQFMPGTASERGLLDPFNPVQALPKSAEFLAELRDQFGNLGLAAAAYNAGPRRVQEWLSGSGGMPQETRSYVLAITGSAIEDWARAGKGGTGRGAGAAAAAPRSPRATARERASTAAPASATRVVPMIFPGAP